MNIDAFKENVKTVADFAIEKKNFFLRSKEGRIISLFSHVEQDLRLEMPDIIPIFDIFRKAKIFDYEIIPWTPELELPYYPDPNRLGDGLATRKEKLKTRSVIIIFSCLEMGNLEREYLRKLGLDHFENKISEINQSTKKRIGQEFRKQLKLMEKKQVKIIEKDIAILSGLIKAPDKLNIFLKQFNRVRGIPKFVDDMIVWGDVKVPMERGHSRMMEIFFEDPRIIASSGKEQKEGTPVNREAFEFSAPYGNDKSFRSALRKVRKKLKDNDLPMVIKNSYKNHFVLEIRLVDK